MPCDLMHANCYAYIYIIPSLIFLRVFMGSLEPLVDILRVSICV